MNRPMRPARNAEVTGAMVAACIRRWDSMAVNWRAPSTSDTGPGSSTVTAMAKPMKTAGTPTSRTHRNRLRSEEHKSELQSLMRISYDVFSLKKQNIAQKHQQQNILQFNNQSQTLTT